MPTQPRQHFTAFLSPVKAEQLQNSDGNTISLLALFRQRHLRVQIIRNNPATTFGESRLFPSRRPTTGLHFLNQNVSDRLRCSTIAEISGSMMLFTNLFVIGPAHKNIGWVARSDVFENKLRVRRVNSLC